MPDADQQLQLALDSWPKWKPSCQRRPELQYPLAESSHQAYVVTLEESTGQTVQAVVKLLDADIRALGLPQAQELALMADAFPLAPHCYYADRQVIVTRHIQADIWTPGEHLDHLGEALAKLHSLPTSLPRFSLTEHCRSYRKTCLLSPEDTAVFEKAIRSVEHLYDRHPLRCVCHNDLIPSNLLVDPNRKIYFLDWEYAALNSPLFDLASLVEYAALSASQLEDLMAGYRRVIRQHSTKANCRNRLDGVNPETIRAFAIAVRLIEWMWQLNAGLPGGVQSRQRLTTLLSQLPDRP